MFSSGCLRSDDDTDLSLALVASVIAAYTRLPSIYLNSWKHFMIPDMSESTQWTGDGVAEAVCGSRACAGDASATPACHGASLSTAANGSYLQVSQTLSLQ